MTTTTLSRTTINLSKQQLAWLKKESGRLGITTGEYLRRIIDQRREHMESLRTRKTEEAGA